jgi:hypothetical protein
VVEITNLAGALVNGHPGLTRGSGGSGAFTGQSLVSPGASRNGGNGVAGLVIITEYLLP